jgi:hypothetical protein
MPSLEELEAEIEAMHLKWKLPESPKEFQKRYRKLLTEYNLAKDLGFHRYV